MISVIICSADERKFQATAEMYQRVLHPAVCEIVGVHDPASITSGYNLGLESSHGKLIIFSHDDVKFVGSDVGAKIENHLAHFDLIGVAGTRRLIDARWLSAGVPWVFGQVAHQVPQRGYTVDIYGIPARTVDQIVAIDGLFMACRREVAEKVRFDEQTFDGFHCYDVDFSLRAHQAGFKGGVCCDLFPVHQSGGAYNTHWQMYAQRFAEKHKAVLPPGTPQVFQWASVFVEREAEIASIMNAPWWG